MDINKIRAKLEKRIEDGMPGVGFNDTAEILNRDLQSLHYLERIEEIRRADLRK